MRTNPTTPTLGEVRKSACIVEKSTHKLAKIRANDSGTFWRMGSRRSLRIPKDSPTITQSKTPPGISAAITNLAIS